MDLLFGSDVQINLSNPKAEITSARWISRSNTYIPVGVTFEASGQKPVVLMITLTLPSLSPNDYPNNTFYIQCKATGTSFSTLSR